MPKRIFMVGDFESNTGPAIANKALKKALGQRANYSQAKTKMGRMAELIRKIIRSQVICFCGFSELNVYGIKLAKLFGKETAYLMHGYAELEAEINHIDINPKRVEAERYILGHVGKIVCVSKLLAEKVKAKYSVRKDSVYVVYDIVEPIKPTRSTVKRNKYQVMSTGGGMPRKNNLAVCKAIKKVNAKLPKKKRLSYIVTGKSYGMKKEFAKYDFVCFLGEISHKKCLQLMQESELYIQNSYFETFGMAAIEAVGCGCDLLTSNRIGSNEIINKLDCNRLINEVDNPDEIAEKITNVLMDKNKAPVSVEWNIISSETIVKRLLNIMEI